MLKGVWSQSSDVCAKEIQSNREDGVKFFLKFIGWTCSMHRIDEKCILWITGCRWKKSLWDIGSEGNIIMRILTVLREREIAFLMGNLNSWTKTVLRNL